MRQPGIADAGHIAEPARMNQGSASSAGAACTNATCVPVAAMAGRAFATSASASRQNVQPNDRRKTIRVGPASAMPASGDDGGKVTREDCPISTYLSSPTHFSSLRASASNLRMPSDNFSTAIGSWLCSQRKVFSSSEIRASVLACAASGVSAGVSSPAVLPQLLQQLGADRQQIAAGELRDLRHPPEAGAHHLGLVAVLLEVVVDARHRLHAGIVVLGNLGAAFLPVPVVDPADERRDQRHPGFGARHRLREAEEQRQVAVDALAFQLLGGLDALPGAAELDQHPLPVHARGLVEPDQLARLGDGGVGVEAEPRIHFGGHAAGDDLQDLLPKPTARRSMNAAVSAPAASPNDLAPARAVSTSARYCGCCAAFNSSDGFVVASCGWC